MALSPEEIRHRRGTQRPGPPRGRGPIGAPAQQVSNADLAGLLQELIDVTQRDALFGATVAYDWLLSSLASGGYAFPVMINMELAIAPGATVTVYIPAPPGYVFYMRVNEYWSSLPWYLTTALWVDSDVPAPPGALFLRTPDHLKVDWSYFYGFARYLRYTVTNNHLVNPANFTASHLLYALTVDSDKMVSKIYVDPIVAFIRSQAEKVSGRPYP